jgi:hypothetical protein
MKIRMMFHFLLVGALIGFSSHGVAAATNGTAFKPEVLSAKAFLEELLVRRYAQELATAVDRPSFTLGAQLDLMDAPQRKEATPQPASVSDTPVDFELGTLDPEELIKKYANDAETAAKVQGFLKDYRIRGVTVSVGLKNDLAPEVKTQVEKWLSARVTAEFGKIGKSAVSFISAPADKPKPPKNFWDRLDQFQELAGKFVLALAFLLGAMLWKGLGAGKPAAAEPLAEPARTEEKSSTLESEKVAEENLPQAGEKFDEEAVLGNLTIAAEIEKLSGSLADLLPRITDGPDRVIRAWCQGGEEGQLKFVCFAEAVGKEIGKLPVPVDALPSVTKVFSRMPEFGMKEKRDVLKKAYWDLLMAVNLGAESFEQPFDYLGGVNVNLVNQTLMDKNPKMKTLVTLHMPKTLRQAYFKSLNEDSKRELLAAAAEMSEIPADELKSLDHQFKSLLRPEGGKSVIPLEMSLNKIIDAMSPVEEIQMLSGMSGAAFERFKRSVPSLAFVGEWKDECLSRLLSRTMPDEIATLLRIKPDLKDRVLALCPPMTAEVAGDELQRPDNTREEEKNNLLDVMQNRIKEMISGKELHLEDAFGEPQAPKNHEQPNVA